MRHALRLIALTLALPVFYLAASILLPLIPGPGPNLSGLPTHRIGLIQGPIHTDILFPLTPDTRARFGFAEPAGVPLNHPEAEWLVFGWGSAAFYTTAGTYADITASAVLTAATVAARFASGSSPTDSWMSAARISPPASDRAAPPPRGRADRRRLEASVATDRLD